MKILLTGATGYIGKRLLPVLLSQGHELVCCVRDIRRFPGEGIYAHPAISLFQIDFIEGAEITEDVAGIEVAYYLIHSMSDESSDFEQLEARSAKNFIKLVEQTKARQIIYLGGIINTEKLSRHLESRKRVEDILGSGRVPLCAIRAGIIVGSGSSSFEIIRDLVEKLPLMIAPRWLNTRISPISIRNILEYLTGVLDNPQTYHQAFDVGGPDVLTYREMLLQFAEVRGLKRRIYTVPVMSPRLSSYWLYFVTSTSYKLAVNLVNSMKVEVVAKDRRLEEMLGISPMSYKQAVELAFQRIGQNNVESSWIDSLSSSNAASDLLLRIEVPAHGCFVDERKYAIGDRREEVLKHVWAIGGKRGWYYANWLWQIRGFLDKLAGGVGLRRGRRSDTEIYAGESLDFWRVLVADKKTPQLLLYAEMRLPGEAWLEFSIVQDDGKDYLQQTATFRPKGVLGRLYWFAVMPLHYFVFGGMIRNIVEHAKKE